MLGNGHHSTFIKNKAIHDNEQIKVSFSKVCQSVRHSVLNIINQLIIVNFFFLIFRVHRKIDDTIRAIFDLKRVILRLKIADFFLFRLSTY